MKFARRSPREGMTGIGSRLAVSRGATWPPSRPKVLSSMERPRRFSELGPLTGDTRATPMVVKSPPRVQPEVPNRTGAAQSSNKATDTRDRVNIWWRAPGSPC